MRRRTIIATAATTAVLVGGGIGAGVALSGGGEGDAEARGPEADAASAAALAHVGSGTVTSVERDGENGATWEVEIRRADGSSVDVRLDADNHVVVTEPDREGPEHGADD